MDATGIESQLDIVELTPARWADLETLFGRSGASGGCWCMWWRVPNKDYDRGEGNKAAFHAITEELCARGRRGTRCTSPRRIVRGGKRPSRR